MRLIASPITPEVIHEFVMEGIREEDALEYQAHSGQPLEGLRDALTSLVGVTEEAYAEALHAPDGTLVALGGWDLRGICWFLCTEAVRKFRVAFTKHIQQRRDDVLRAVPVLTNEVWIGNSVHVHFLRRLGAEFSEHVFTRGGLPFTRFYIQRKEAASV